MKYSKEQLKKMAKILLKAKLLNDDRYLKFCFSMMAQTGACIEYIEDTITKYARG